MSAPSKGSRWGSLLSQAVAGVEARLDNILAEDDPIAKPQPQPQPPPPSRPSSAASNLRPAQQAGKSANDRLQERLARAVAAKNSASAGSPKSEASPARLSAELSSANRSPRPSSDLVRAESPALAVSTSPRSSLSKDENPSMPVQVAGNEQEKQTGNTTDPTDAGDRSLDSAESRTLANGHTSSPAAVPQPIAPSAKEDTVQVSITTSERIVSSLDIYEKRIADLEKTLDETQRQHQDELHIQIEQVDALQAKLQYLAREASEAARKDVSTAAAGSMERKLAEKEQQVAQLMEEGNKLAGNEQKLRAVIKKLRAQITAEEKEANGHQVWRQKAEIELLNLRETVRSIEDYRKASDESQNTMVQLRRDLDRIKTVVASRDATISDIKAQLQEERERATTLTAKVNDQLRNGDQRRIKDLEDSLAAMQVERSLAADKAKATAKEMREKAERAAERTRAVELEMKGEVQVLESKLEALRATAEEASSGAIGDAQAKLLRQIETLQTQYSIASENWQGMESSLLARTASLEKERDEALRRESEMRRKARESAARAKRQEEELEEAKTQLPNVQRDLSNHQAQIENLRKRAEEAERALSEMQADVEKPRIARQDSIDKTAADRRPWLEEVALQSSRPASPLLSTPQRTYSGDFLGLQNFPTKLRKSSAPSSNGDTHERPSSARRPSQQPRPSLFSMPSAQSGGTPPSILAGLEQITSPTHPLDKEDMFDSVETSASPHNVLHDMVSVSTIAAGPSVQLVERMSAAIRRLESEKVAAREELARITSQRDDARAEIVTLMKDVEIGKSANTKVDVLEKEVAELHERYQTTLEMLGEKSELVEELRADVDDVKAMYRDLVERTHK